MSKNKGKRCIISYFFIIILAFFYINFRFELISTYNNTIIIKNGRVIKKNKNTKEIATKHKIERSRYNKENIVTNINTGNWINNQYVVTKKDKSVLDNMVGEEKKYTNAIINEFKELGFQNTSELNLLAKKYFKEEKGLDKLGTVYLENNFLCVYFFYHKYNLEVDYNELANFYMYENSEIDVKIYAKVGVYSVLKKTEENVYYYDGIVIFEKEVANNKFKCR